VAAGERADRALVARGLFDSRAKARAAIEAGRVTADGRLVTKASDPIAPDAVVVAEAAHPWVGRGALKLVQALERWPIVVAGRTVLDVGASTGGFTEVCLSRGAARVYAVDVGRGQLHAKLRDDSRVVSLEGLDARDLTPALVPDRPGLVVCDVSFIALAKALATLVAILPFRLGGKTTVFTALGMTQIGEFSYVLARAGREVGALSETLNGLILTSSLLTIILTPGAFRIAPRVAAALPNAECRMRSAE